MDAVLGEDATVVGAQAMDDAIASKRVTQWTRSSATERPEKMRRTVPSLMGSTRSPCLNKTWPRRAPRCWTAPSPPGGRRGTTQWRC